MFDIQTTKIPRILLAVLWVVDLIHYQRSQLLKLSPGNQAWPGGNSRNGQNHVGTECRKVVADVHRVKRGRRELWSRHACWDMDYRGQNRARSAGKDSSQVWSQEMHCSICLLPKLRKQACIYTRLWKTEVSGPGKIHSVYTMALLWCL